ncbi:transcriptional repressor [Candidatus Saccharibacteria bacterium]|nr:transcriptional repressor [Candidatus Saccharibacteria bacterium]
MNALYQRLTKVLARKNLRLTKPRLAIFTALCEAHDSLALSEISRQVPDIDRATVYRTLELFCSLGVAQQVNLGFKRKYELAAPYHAHHHHLYCDGCGLVISFDSSSLEQLLEYIAAQKGIRLSSHSLELSGRCKDCQ